MQGNAEYQRRCMMTHDEKTIGAIERVARNIQIYEAAKGTPVSWDIARRKAEAMAYRLARR